MLPLEVATPLALLGLLLVIPVIVLYLLKPKPKNMRFPTLMFVMRAEKTNAFASFLRKLIRDPILFAQLLVIGLLVFAIAQPYILAFEERGEQETAVIILDSSASMKAFDVSPSRFEKARQLAGEILERMGDESSISIVAAENVPVLLAKDAEKRDAERILYSAFVSDAPTNLGDAVIFARDLLDATGRNRRIYVFSDFSNSEGTDLFLAEKMAAQDNVSVEYVKVAGKGANLAVTSFSAKRFITDASRFHATFTVASFMEEDVSVTVELLVDDAVAMSYTEDVEAGGQKLLSYEGTLSDDAHRLRVVVKNPDSLEADNTAYFYIPQVDKYRVLLIKTEEGDKYLKYALESTSHIELETAIMPIVPKFDGFDAILVGELNEGYMQSWLFKDLRYYVENGGNVVFLPSDALAESNDFDLSEMLPVKSFVHSDGSSDVTVPADHEIFADIVPKESENVPGVSAKKYLHSNAKDESEIVAYFGESPAVATMAYGKGKTVYVGLSANPLWSNFYYASSFPIFWLQLVRWTSRDHGRLGVNNFNTGDYVPVVKWAQVETPSGKTLKDASVILDEAGFYRMEYVDGEDVLSASLLSDAESDISSSLDVESLADESHSLISNEKEHRTDLFAYVLAAVLAFMALETILYMRRGLL